MGKDWLQPPEPEYNWENRLIKIYSNCYIWHTQNLNVSSFGFFGKYKEKSHLEG